MPRFHTLKSKADFASLGARTWLHDRAIVTGRMPIEARRGHMVAVRDAVATKNLQAYLALSPAAGLELQNIETAFGLLRGHL